jgi:hypothetical protein
VATVRWDAGTVLIVLVQLVPVAAVDRVLKQLPCCYVLLCGRAELVGRGPAELAVLGRLWQPGGPHPPGTPARGAPYSVTALPPRVTTSFPSVPNDQPRAPL